VYEQSAELPLVTIASSAAGRKESRVECVLADFAARSPHATEPGPLHWHTRLLETSRINRTTPLENVDERRCACSLQSC
jgi:hypothetical protein